jgi:hypothetical protein
MPTSATYINAVKADLEEARRWGDIGEISRLSEEIREYEDYRDHCDDMRAEFELQDARFESYWEARL